MARYFFHIHQNGQLFKDKEGSEIASLEQVRIEAMQALPEIAKDEVPRDGDRQAFSVMVTDEAGELVYSASLTFAGLWLS